MCGGSFCGPQDLAFLSAMLALQCFASLLLCDLNAFCSEVVMFEDLPLKKGLIVALLHSKLGKPRTCIERDNNASNFEDRRGGIAEAGNISHFLFLESGGNVGSPPLLNVEPVRSLQ